MSCFLEKKDLADVIADNLMKGREDAGLASEEIADAIYSLIEVLIEERTGAC